MHCQSVNSAAQTLVYEAVALTRCLRRSSSLKEFGFIAHLLHIFKSLGLSLISCAFLRVWVIRPALAKVDLGTLALCVRALRVFAWREGVLSLASVAYELAHWFETVSLALSASRLVPLVFFLSHNR